MTLAKQKEDNGEGSDGTMSATSGILPDEHSLANLAEGNRRNSSSTGRGYSGERLRISNKEAEKRAYQDIGEALNLALGHEEFASQDEQAQSEKRAYQDIREALNLVLGHEEFASQDEQAQYAVHAMLAQASGEPPLESAAGLPMMPSLRRSQAAVFSAGRSSADEAELRCPTQRVIKSQPQQGQVRPGAYAHNSVRRISGLTADAAQPTEATDETWLEAESRSPSGVADTPFTDSVERNKHSIRWFNLLVWLIVLAGVAAVVIGVSVALSGSKSGERRICTEASMTAIEQQCPNMTTVITVIPECILKLREELLSRLSSSLGVTATEDSNDCSAENLSLFSVALHTSSKDSVSTLSNRLGLTKLFYGTDGREWYQRNGWLSTKPHCEWEGVLCNELGNVAALVIDESNMQGSLPSRIMSLLPKLTSLSIMGNKLTGTLPPELSELHLLSARGNSLTGTLARTQWKSLLFAGTTVGGDFLSRISALSNLVTLNLNRVNLAGTLPTEIGKLTSLTDLQVYGNLFLGGVIPTELQKLTALQGLTLGECAFSGTIPSELGKLTGLRELDLGINKLTGGMPTELGLLTKLTALLFSDNRLEGAIPSEVCALKISGDLVDLGLSASSIWEDDVFLSCPHGGLICPISKQSGCCS